MGSQSQSGKIFLKTLIVLFLLIAIPVGVWVGVNLWPREMPKALFTEVDLPIEENPQENGWNLYLKLWEDGSLDGENIEISGDLDSIVYLEPPKNFADAMKFWGEVNKKQEILGRLIKEKKDVIGKYEEILNSPQFVDTTPFDPREKGISFVDLMELHRLGTAYVLNQMFQGKTEDAYSFWLKMFKLDMAWLGSARSLMSHMGALAQIHEDLKVLFFLQFFGSPSDPMGILQELKNFQGKDLNLQRAITYEYLSYLAGVDSMVEEWLETQDFWIQIVFNRALLRRDMNRKFRTVLKYLKNPDAITEAVIEKFDRDERRDRDIWYWWFYNPGGKLLRALIHTNHLEHMKKFHEDKKELMALLSLQIQKLEEEKQEIEVDQADEEMKIEEKPSKEKELPAGFSLADQLEKEPDQVLTQEVPLRLVEKYREEGPMEEDIQVAPYLSGGKEVGLKVLRLEPESIFAKMGWKAGDILLAVQGQDIGPRFQGNDFFIDFPKAEGEDWEILLFRDGKITVIEIIPKRE